MTKKEQKLINQYNQSGTVAVITSYPAKKNRSVEDIDAVASYADHFVKPFSNVLRTKGGKVIVLCQKIKGEAEFYQEGNVLVIRCWERGSVKLFWQLSKTLKNLDWVKKVLLQFEFNQFGGVLVTGLLPLFLAFLKILDKKVYLLLHQVVLDISCLSGHLAIKKKSFKNWFFNLALRWFYFFLGNFTDMIIVHDKELRKRFRKINKKATLKVVPHGLGEYKKRISKKLAREKLGFSQNDFLVLSFGFVTWYKGTDWLMEKFLAHFAKNSQSKLRLVIAGGPSANLKDKPHYQKFYQKVIKKAASHEKITLTGFVSDKKVPWYFSAVDMVVLPYRAKMSASGPLALALNFKKPFLISNKLINSFDNRLSASQKREITFSLSNGILLKRLENLSQNKKFLREMTQLSDRLAEERSWDKVCLRLINLIEEERKVSLGTEIIPQFVFSKS